MSQNTIKIVEAKTKKELLDFIKVPFYLYSSDSFYSPQLIRDQLIHFSKANPFFEHAGVKFFIAYKGNKLAGRIASIINNRHISFHKEDVGFFGFFESINDQEVSRLLLNTVSEVLIKQKLKYIRGPMNFSTNEECGFLLEGFESPPMIMTPYNPPYYNDLMESYGMYKAKDLFAFIYNISQQIPDKVNRIANIAERRGIRTRILNKSNFISDMLAFREVYNSAWEKNWGFIPLTENELFYSAKRLKQIIVPELTLLAFEGDNPVGFLGAIPDFNLVLRKMKGKINPVSIVKALYYSKKITDLRLLLFGIKREFRQRGVDAILLRDTFKNLLGRQYRRVEFSWIIEDNIPTIKVVNIANARLYKKYRIYEKKL